MGIRPASVALASSTKQAYSGAPVIAVFDNLLPDSDHLRRQIAARTHAEGTDAYSLLGASDTIASAPSSSYLRTSNLGLRVLSKAIESATMKSL